ncbi:hypothetical protein CAUPRSCDRAFT_12432 [Caulochytrium protostelioides]|uniref:Uncharacterized protein n=1 Tax=Caulochytrium protostelioides TaxID=1555241 RepID=A0A4P9WRR2_9FUNG|nr:hypothetical protein CAUPRSCDRAFT_12432 [Caulochytrium protostelioides]
MAQPGSPVETPTPPRFVPTTTAPLLTVVSPNTPMTDAQTFRRSDGLGAYEMSMLQANPFTGEDGDPFTAKKWKSTFDITMDGHSGTAKLKAMLLGLKEDYAWYRSFPDARRDAACSPQQDEGIALHNGPRNRCGKHQNLRPPGGENSQKPPTD